MTIPRGEIYINFHISSDITHLPMTLHHRIFLGLRFSVSLSVTIVELYEVIACYMLPQNNDNLPLLLFSGNYPILLLDNNLLIILFLY